MKDFLGREINIGDTVVYPRRGGSNIWLGRGIVIDVAYGPQGSGRGVIVKADTLTGVKRTGQVPAERCVVVGA